MFTRLFNSFLSYPHYLIYGLIFGLMIFLGEEILLVIGALARLGYIDFWDTVFFAYLGTLAGDIFWYRVGAKYGENFITRYGRWFFMSEKRFRALKGIIIKNGGLFIFLSKFMYCMNHISVVAAGAVKFNFGKYIRIQLFVSAAWTLAFVSLGYFFADNLTVLKHDVTLFTIVLLLVFAAFIALDKLIERLLEKKIIKINNGNGE